MKYMLTWLLACGIVTASTAQQTIQGKIIDRLSREPLELAYIRLENKATGVLTNKQGYFSIPLANGETFDHSARLIISFIGYDTKMISLAGPGHDLMIIEMEKGAVQLQEVVITPQSSTTSFQTISKIDLNLQPVKSAQDILRIVPGLFIGQHQGGGKAEQIFLRGFDIDHGTDINVSVDGMPVNMVSHAHGQGYADLHFLIPELTAKVDYGKGPYYTPYGNLGTAGYVSLETLNSLDKNVVKLEGGRYNTLRGLAMINLLSPQQKEKGTNAYIAGEFLYSDGPFESAQHFNRFNLFGKFNSRIGANNKLTVIASTLSSDWDASGQVPQRSVDDGSISRFGYIDNTEGGYTSRTNASAKLTSYIDHQTTWENQLFYSRYQFNLHSNFTFFLNDPVNGDQIRQREKRDIIGFNSKLSRNSTLGSWSQRTEYGAGFRYDMTKGSELSRTINRNTVLDYLQLGNIREFNAYGYAEKFFEKGKWLLNVGVRADLLGFRYDDQLTASQQPGQDKLAISPKINIQYTLNTTAQLYLKTGKGFHSNDARVVVRNAGQDILPAAYGADLGILWKPVPNLLVNAAAWYLYLQQEFVYVGDEGIIEPSGRSRRIGIDLSGRYQVNSWLFADVNINLAKPRSMDDPKGENYIPLAPEITSTGGLNWQMRNGFNGSIRYRYLKDRAANEDKSVIAKGYTVTDLSFNYTRKKYELGLTIENLFDVGWNETQFDTESRLKNEPASVSEIHFTPGVPFFPRLKLAVFF